MMSVERLFRRARAVLEGHFELTSGLHSQVYWEKMRVLQDPGLTRLLCRPLADHFRGQGVEVVAGPALGGVVLAYEVARQLSRFAGTGKRVRAVYAERDGEEGRAFRQGQRFSPGERVLIVDDVLTTGGSLRQMVTAVAGVGGEVVGIGVIVDRSQQPPDLGLPFFACHRISLPTYPPQQCPLCRQGIPLEKLGGKR